MTEARRIVSNTGPLISLEKLRQGYDFIRQLYDMLIIPPGVLDEVAAGQLATPQAYLQHYRVAQGMGLSISGIAGQVLKAFRQGAITAQEARNKLRELLQAGRMNRKIYEALLAVIP